MRTHVFGVVDGRLLLDGDVDDVAVVLVELVLAAVQGFKSNSVKCATPQLSSIQTLFELRGRLEGRNKILFFYILQIMTM